MSELFNWGGETPEQRQARLRWEQELLVEQARMKAMAIQAGAVGGGSNQGTCAPELGIGLYIQIPFDVDLFGVGLLPSKYLGELNDKPSYGYTITPGLFSQSLYFDPKKGQWQIDFLSEGETLTSNSNQLIGSNWSLINSPEFPIEIQQTKCGFSDPGSYCLTFPEYEGLQAQPFPVWIGEVEGLPVIWQMPFGSFIWVPTFNPEAPAGWSIQINDVGEIFIEGGSQDQLPLGEFIIPGSPSFTIIVNEGACEF